MTDEPNHFSNDSAGEENNRPEEGVWGYFDDEGNALNPDLIPKPGLCLSCRKDADAHEEILCNLTRLDQQKEAEFICFAYESLAHKKPSEE